MAEDSGISVRVVDDRNAKTQVSSRWAGKPDAWVRLVKWHQEHRTAVMVASYAAAIVGTAWLVRRSSGSSTPAPSSAPSSSASSSSAAIGSTLVIHTPKGQPGRVRESASLRARIVAILPAGTRVEVLGESSPDGERWYNVRTSKGTGWIHSDILKGDG